MLLREEIFTCSRYRRRNTRWDMNLVLLKSLKLARKRFLINHFEKLTDELLLEIVNSEEFGRGLLKILLSDKPKAIENLEFILGGYTNLKDELITLEDDGSSFYWYNPHVPKDQVEKKMNELKLTKANS